MPQIWMTYQELGDLAGAPAEDARDFVIARGWDRRRSQDGLTRVKLPDDVMLEWLQSVSRSGTRELGPQIATLPPLRGPLSMTERVTAQPSTPQYRPQ